MKYSVCMSYLGHSLGKSYPSAEMQSVYSMVPTDWAKRKVDPSGMNSKPPWVFFKIHNFLKPYNLHWIFPWMCFGYDIKLHLF